jgi:integrase
MNIDEGIKRILNNGLKKSYLWKKEPAKLSEQQLKTLKKFYEYYSTKPSSRGGMNKKTSCHNILQSLRTFGIFIKKSYEDVTQEDLIKFTKYAKEKYKIKTYSTIRTHLYTFYNEFLNKTELFKHKLLAPVSTKTTRKPSDLLNAKELETMLRCAGSWRNKVIVMLTFGEGGLRAGEILSLTKDSVEFDKYGCKIWVNKSKTNERYVRLIDSEPYIQEYLNKEYSLKKDNDPLFYGEAGKYHGKKLQNSNAINQLLKRIARTSGIKKRIYSHLGRHQSINQLKKEGLSTEMIAQRSGITTSTVGRVYLHLTDKDSDEAYMKVKGVIEKTGSDELRETLKPKECHRCHKINPSTNVVCSCGMILDNKKAMEIAQKEKFVDDLINVQMSSEDLKNLNFNDFIEKHINKIIEDKVKKGEL